MTDQTVHATTAAPAALLRRIPGVTFILVGMIVLFAVGNPRFLSAVNLTNIGLQASLLLMLALPMTLIILTAGLDLSVGALLGLCGVVIAALLVAGWSLPAAVAAAMLVGLVAGAVNGFLVGYLGLPAFVVTLGTMGLCEGLSLVITNGDPIGGFTPALEAFYRSTLLGLPTPVLVAAILYGLLSLLLYRTRFGNYVFAIGGNKDALHLAGINANLVHMGVYLLCSLTVALSALLLLGRTNSAHPSVAVGMEFEAIAAVVLGGTSFEKGQGWLFGTVLGVLAISVLRNGLNVLSVEPSLQVVCVGLLLIAALLIDRNRKQASRDIA
ncbi:ABC transporter permease [Bradyrhizobium sp. CCBAU 51753]|uniref:ABC transporter permease n=1 Tax=Bradyrhizobium sp. CCBAU 51753 TaxID=1325100 RepID=UPI00188A6221|nr:ABC transporter permease [Bradyrhizobium sp. CCBAU 51753]QOZ27988.1 ABC transporter permease [Bradyrhizobium sp. CCBAU 51753]